jgi:hypothetical protein
MPTPLFKLRLNETVAIAELARRGPGTYYQPLWAEGNAIVSTLLVDEIDAGATISVTFEDVGMSESPYDVTRLGAHEDMASAPKASKVAVTRFHNRPRIKTIISGGSVSYGQWLTLKDEYVPLASLQSGQTQVYTGAMTPGTIISLPSVADAPIQQLSVRAVTDQPAGHRLKISLDNQTNWLTLAPGEIFAIVPRGEIRQIYLDGLTHPTGYEVILLTGQ